MSTIHSDIANDKMWHYCFPFVADLFDEESEKASQTQEESDQQSGSQESNTSQCQRRDPLSTFSSGMWLGFNIKFL